jgi:hypothetical protein
VRTKCTWQGGGPPAQARLRAKADLASEIWGSGIELQDSVQVIAHHGVGVNRNGKALAQPMQPFADPVLPMFEITPRQLVVAAKKGAADTPLNAVIASFSTFRRNELSTWASHGASMADLQVGSDGKSAGKLSENPGVWVSQMLRLWGRW